MTARESPGGSALRDFVQQTLGCGCPEEVFQRIETAPVRWGGVSGRRITVGGRLLIAVFDTDDGYLVRRSAGDWVEAGVRTRDAEGLNRVRIVIASAHPERLAPLAEAAFAESTKRDEKSHLHVVDRKSCPWETGQ